MPLQQGALAAFNPVEHPISLSPRASTLQEPAFGLKLLIREVFTLTRVCRESGHERGRYSKKLSQNPEPNSPKLLLDHNLES